MRRILLASGGLAALFSASAAVAQVAGDECTTAVTLVPGTPASFSTANATGSSQPVDASQCTGTFLNWGPPASNPDVWFRWTPTSGGLATFSTCQGVYDTSMVIYSGACNGLTQVACNGDGTGQTGCGNPFYSRIANLPITANTTYFVRIGGYEGETGASILLLTFFSDDSVCGGNNQQSCSQAGPNPGCSNAECCETVCAGDSFCCDFEWDQSCADAAVQSCGIFVYSCPPGGPANNCATNPTVVLAGQSLAFNTTNAATTAPPGCESYDPILSKEVWYRFNATSTTVFTATTCNTADFDTKMRAYAIGDGSNFNPNNLPSLLIACNDDGAASCANFTSTLSFNVTAGQSYLVALGGYAGESGSGTVAFSVLGGCEGPNPNAQENEPCGTSNNGGCNDTAGGAPTRAIALGDRMSGTFWADGGTRDTDWYSFSLSSPAQVSAAVFADYPVSIFILSGACGSTVTLAANDGENCPQTASACLNPGSYFVFVALDAFAGLPCGSGTVNNYTLDLSATPSSCPATITSSCENPGPDTYSTAPAVGAWGGLVACATGGGAFPDCSLGASTTVNSWAKVVPAPQILKELTCLNLGVFSVRRGATATACAFFASDVPLPATIGIYRDINGGAPTRPFEANGDCLLGNCDLVLIEERQVLIPGGGYLGTLTFDPPLCLGDVVPSGETLVVTLTTPNFVDGSVEGIPANAGYQLRAAGATIAGQPSNTFVRLSCADAAQAYVAAESLGATFTAQWRVDINGDNASCGSGPPPCPWDLNGDGQVNGADLGLLLQNWGSPFTGADLGALLQSWGACPQ